MQDEEIIEKNKNYCFDVQGEESYLMATMKGKENRNEN